MSLAEEVRISVADSRAIEWSPNGELLAASSKEKIEIWKLSSEDHADQRVIRTKILTGHQDWVRSVSWSSDSRMIASTSWDGSVRIFDVQTGQAVRTLIPSTKGNLGSIFTVDWKSGSNLIASVHSDSSKVEIWDASTGATVKSLPSGRWGLVSVQWSPDGNYLVASSWKEVFVWQADSDRVETSFAPQDCNIIAVKWHPDGRRIAVIGSIADHPAIWIWNTTTGEVLIETQH